MGLGSLPGVARATTSGKVRAATYDLRDVAFIYALYHLRDNYRWKDIICRHGLDGDRFQ
jgi:hypothetical protein